MRQTAAAYVAMTALVTLVFALLNARVAHPWIVGEWLINYSGGFVRRGLPGEMLLRLHRGTHLPLIGLACALQLAVYGLFYVSLLRLLRGVRWSLPLLALLLSPATLAFTVLDPPTSVRKEGLLFLVLALLLNLQQRGRPRARAMAALLSVAAPLLVLSHEALLAFLPYLAVPALLLFPLRRAMGVLALPTVLAMAAFVAVVWHPGRGEQVAAICHAVSGGSVHGVAGGFAASGAMATGGVCSGAIAYLRFTPAEAAADASRAMHFYHYGTRYPLPMLLAFLPVALLVRRRLRERQRMLPVLSMTVVSVLASLPLFAFARDWGRWVEIHAMCLLLLLLALEQRQPLLASATGSPSATMEDSHGGEALVLPQRSTARTAALLALVLYGTCWTLPAVGLFPGRFGYVDLLRYLQGYRGKPHLTNVIATSP